MSEWASERVSERATSGGVRSRRQEPTPGCDTHPSLDQYHTRTLSDFSICTALERASSSMVPFSPSLSKKKTNSSWIPERVRLGHTLRSLIDRLLYRIRAVVLYM